MCEIKYELSATMLLLPVQVPGCLRSKVWIDVEVELMTLVGYKLERRWLRAALLGKDRNDMMITNEISTIKK